MLVYLANKRQRWYLNKAGCPLCICVCFIDVQFIFKVTGVQQSDSVIFRYIYIYMYILFQILFHYRLL